MRKLVFMLVLVLLVACKSSTVVINNTDHSQNQISKLAKSDVIMVTPSEVKKGGPIKSQDLINTVTYLVSDELQGRDTGIEGIEKVAIYIENILKKNAIKPFFETYRDSFNVNNLHAYNIVGFLEGNNPELKNEFVIIGAHYDHIGTANEVNGDVIANGANDNAAGTSGVLEIAKYLAAKKNNKRSIIIALFSAEEKGLIGSKHLAKKLKSKNIDLYIMLNFEMIGVPFKDRNYEAFITGYEMSNMSKKINDYTNTTLTGFSEVSKQYNLFKQSDNYAFYNEFNLPCHTISSCDLSNYDYYHHVDDEADKLDFKHMTSLLNKILPAIEMICNTPSKEIKMYDE